MGVKVHELDSNFLESAVTQQVAFHTGECLVGIVVGLLDQTQFVPLRLIESRLDTVSLLKPLET
jgi:hypothetical protein